MSENTTPSASTAPIESAEPVESQEPALEASAEAPKAEEALKPAEIKKEEKRLKKLKLKVDGKEYDEEVNLDDDEYLIKQLQLAKVAQKRMGEHSQLQKDMSSFIEELKKNPRKILSNPNIGVDVKKMVAEFIEEEIANSQKSPEQLEKEKLQARLKELEEERKTEKEEFEKREFERLQEQEYERYDTLMTSALQKADLPKTPYVVKKMADYLLMGLQDGQDISPEDVIPLVREEMQSDLKAMFAVMPDEVIEQLVGKDVIGRIRKKSVAKAKEKGVPPQPLSKSLQDTGSKEKKDEEPKKRMTIKEFLGT